jgi:hypothetical protein
MFEQIVAPEIHMLPGKCDAYVSQRRSFKIFFLLPIIGVCFKQQAMLLPHE